MKISDSLETCINTHFVGEYYFTEEERTLENLKTGDIIQVSE